MADPKYVYRPWSPEHRKRLSLIHKSRLGIPADCVQIYGVHVPAQMEWPLRQYASWLRQKSGMEAAISFVRKAIELKGRIAKPSPDKITKTDPRYVYRPWPSTVERLRRLQWRRAFVELRRGIRAAYVAHRAALRLATEERRQRLTEAAMMRRGLRQIGRGIRAAYVAHRAVERAWQQRLRNLGRGLADACRAQRSLAKAIERFAKFFGRPVRQRTDWGLVDALLSEYASREEVARFLGITENYLRLKMQQRKRDGLSEYSGRKGFA